MSRLDVKHDGPSGAVVTGTFTFSVVPAPSPDQVKEIFAPYVADLDSKSFQRRQIAETVSTFLPTPFLEPYLIRMLADPFPNDAIQGLRRLNSEGSRAALFHSIESATLPGRNVDLAEALANMGNATYAPKLIALLWQTSGTNQKAVLDAAARLDPKQTRPAIQRYLNAADGASREIGAKYLVAPATSLDRS